MNKGIFITLEGIDGCGKTSVAQTLWTELKQRGYEVVYTREPGGSPVGEHIREFLLSKDNATLDPLAEVYLFAASRRQHLKDVIVPALEEGKVVICDRYIHSSLAYQGYGKCVGADVVAEINRHAIKINCETYLPDLTFYLDVTPRIGRLRINDRHEELNRFDIETESFFESVRDGYKEIARITPYMKTIDANLAYKDVDKQVIDTLDLFLKTRG